MGYIHFYRQLKSVPNDQWLLFTTQVAIVFLLIQNRHVPGHIHPLVLCTHDGKYPLLRPNELLIDGLDGQPAIAFNGEERSEMSYETFYIGQHSSGREFCETTFNWRPTRPYDFMVKATLLVAHRFCPDCYDILSDGTLAEWTEVQVWLMHNLGGEWPIPEEIILKDE